MKKFRYPYIGIILISVCKTSCTCFNLSKSLSLNLENSHLTALSSSSVRMKKIDQKNIKETESKMIIHGVGQYQM